MGVNIRNQNAIVRSWADCHELLWYYSDDDKKNLAWCQQLLVVGNKINRQASIARERRVKVSYKRKKNVGCRIIYSIKVHTDNYSSLMDGLLASFSDLSVKKVFFHADC